MPGYITHSVRLLAVPLLLAGVAGGVAPGAASAAKAGIAGTAVPFRISGNLYGVAATSASSAWAVGYGGSLTSPKPLIVHWNGTSWKQAPNPAPAGTTLAGVAATSATNAWAVGSTSTGKALIERWNGTAWAQVPAPHPGSFSSLSGVAAVSASSAWAVGCTTCATPSGFNGPLIEGWDGKAWAQTPSPGLGAPGGILAGVAALSATSAWAVGGTVNGVGASAAIATLIAQWNGVKWTRVPSPTPGGRAALSAVAAVSATSAWAVGNVGAGKTLIERWNGTAWKVS